MTQRIKYKIEEIKKYLEDLKEVTPDFFSEYENDLKTRLACERCYEKVIEAITDLSFRVINFKKLEIPGDDKQVFDILEEAGIITEDSKKSMKEARGMRNILAHQYGSVDDEIVFEAITKEIIGDANKFLDRIGNFTQ